MQKYTFDAMSTFVEIGTLSEINEDLLNFVTEQIHSIENICSRFLVNSELSQLNQQIGEKVNVSIILFDILQKALEFYEETNGLFNPGILRSLEYAGYSKSIEQIRKKEISKSPVFTNFSVVGLPYELHKESHAVTLFSTIDFGGIAKGWILDDIAALLQPYANGFINIGGDIRIFDTLPRPLYVGVEHPFEAEATIDSLAVSSGAIATSTSTKRRWTVNGETQHHLIDPFTGNPSKSHIASATVTAPTAMQADVYAKVALLLGEENGKQWLKDKKINAILISDDCNVWRENNI